MIFSRFPFNRAFYLKKIKIPNFYWNVGNRQAVTNNPPAQNVTKNAPERYADYYLMDHKKRGLAIIFNHVKFDSGVERTGSNKDRDDLKTLFEELKFEVQIHNDLTARGVEDVLIAASKKDHSDADCLVVTALTHGNKDHILAKDKSYVARTLWSHFNATICPSLAGKPKLFFIEVWIQTYRVIQMNVVQASRGTKSDKGAALQAKTLETSSKRFYTIPILADILVMYSTVEGYSSFSQDGSFFIQALVKQLRTHHKNYDLMIILTFVNRQVAIDFTSKGDAKAKQMCSIVSSLTRLVDLSG